MRGLKRFIAISIICLCFGAIGVAQTNVFTYQGRLTDSTLPATGNFDFEFRLCPAGPFFPCSTPLGIEQRFDVPVTNGTFTVALDFDAELFNGGNRSLEIWVRRRSSDPWAVLTPRQEITSAPYAIRSLTSGTADNSSRLGGVAASQYVQTNDTRLSDARDPLPNSTHYIQNNPPTQQASSSFNISGNGTLGGTLSANGLVVYPTTGNGALFMRNRTNSNFSQVVFADALNQYRGYIGYIGSNAGLGARNDTVEFGSNVADITFRPYEAEVMRLSGSRVGIGTPNPTFKLEIVDPQNTGIRVQTNATGGSVASFGGNGTFAIDAPGIFGGRFAVLENGYVGIGTSSPANKLTVSGIGVVRAAINSDSDAGFALRLNNQPRWSVSVTSPGDFRILNDNTGQSALTISDQNNVGIGGFPISSKLFVQKGGAGGVVAEFGSNGEFWINNHNTGGGRFRVFEDGTVWINDPPLDLPNETSTRLVVNGVIKAGFRDVFAGGTTPLCHNNSRLIVVCSSSIRFKENVNNFSSGLELLRRLRPVSFNWKQDGIADIGLIAEEVEQVDSRLVIYNDIGQIEGVKYDRLSAAFVNAFKEQQAQIERQQGQIDELKKLVCAMNSSAEICKPQ